MSMRPRSAWPWVLLLVVMVAVGSGAAMYWRRQDAAPKPWQAVFLTNGQVYFGHLARSRVATTMLLTDVYYIQVAPRLQAQNSGTGTNEAGTANAADLALVKLGDELHRPTDAMRINRAHVLFTEELRADGPVVQTIERMQRGVPTAAPQAAPAAAAPGATGGDAAAPANGGTGKTPGASDRR
ncbi:hypothetical protein HYV74_03575 [Candidatus Uhrbacteria bacterium]|nr:hypothetical protein [Candidatus Uhrbacteria bacterium]